ncbi:putative glycerol-3-phosphate transporter 1 [Iris pallida]|uniref:Glycerol-3-phosphate transporter 1 n=1 Tax=Iris pallida TaxID=29817 RepID=A0AAX6ICY4_IRIPA|nr:putative glycerol-3-phosphate transporter 1 [Iris pallida]
MKSFNLSFRTHQSIVLILTFVAYASYHATRKTTSIVKSVLDPENSLLPSVSPLPWPSSYFLSTATRTGWAPFDGPGGTAMLGVIDVAFLSVYALGMYFAGHLGDRVDLRVLLAVGMAGTGVLTSLFGAGYWLDIHSFYYYLAVQSLAGLFQSSGWPSVVAVVGNWCGRRRRGLVMGVWNAHTSVGNIFGSLVASALLGHGWGWSFVVPGLVVAVLGLVVFLFLNVSPEAAGIGEEEGDCDDGAGKEKSDGKEPLLGGAGVEKLFSGPDSARDSGEVLLSSNSSTEEVGDRAVGFMEAWRIPGVAPFALCLFFSKLVAYTFLYWLPFYISHTAIEGQYLSNSTAGTLSTLFDVGGVVGGVLAGHVSDRLNARAVTAASFTYCAVPALYLYRSYGGVSLSWNVALMLVAGVFVNGPYALITTAVSADLGARGPLGGGSRALATVTAIIDGTGSLGAAVGPLLTGYVSARSWGAVFTMLMAAALVAGLLLTRLVVAEVASKIRAGAAASTQASGIMEERV